MNCMVDSINFTNIYNVHETLTIDIGKVLDLSYHFLSTGKCSVLGTPMFEKSMKESHLVENGNFNMVMAILVK